ncbi:ATP-binding protein [Streptomyces sp. NPDC048392]|uniref:ATP-binding protein n=1 Tax=Streptomyces sp. NPDC048392 TaxID=3365543 RepID=UPI0037204CB5
MTTTETAAQIPSPRRDTGPEEVVDTAIDEACRTLHLPTIRSRVQDMASEAMRQRSSYKDFLADLLEAECAEREERRKSRLVRESEFPQAQAAGGLRLHGEPERHPRARRHLVGPGLGQGGTAALPDR